MTTEFEAWFAALPEPLQNDITTGRPALYRISDELAAAIPAQHQHQGAGKPWIVMRSDGPSATGVLSLQMDRIREGR
jgi:hypothetical protein